MTKYQIPTTLHPCKTSIQKNNIKIILLIILCASIILYIGVQILSFFISQNNLLTPTQNYYLICTPNTNPDNTIQQQTQNIKMRGGAGNIININNENIIALHAYLTNEKAQEISKNLNEQGISTQIYKLSTKKYNLNNYTTNEQQNILSNINFIFDILTNLYNIITQFDSINITENKLYTHIHKLKISCELELHSLTTITNFETNPIYLQMLEITSIIESLCNRDFNGYNITSIGSEFKYTFVQILLTICNPIL